MRILTFFCLLLTLAGISFAQTPGQDDQTAAQDQTQAEAQPQAQPEVQAAPQEKDTNFPSGPQYLITSGSSLFLRSISTPSLSLGQAPPASAAAEAEAGEGVQLSISPAVQTPPDLYPIYYGPSVAPPIHSEIELSSGEVPRNLPPGFFDVGVTRMTDATSMREWGYSVSLGDDAKYWKTHKLHAVRVFTNQDVERLHGG